jgi:alpha-N-arabinofuranosidase
MLTVHPDATMLPLNLEAPEYKMGVQYLPSVSASASKDEDGKIHLSLANIDPGKSIDLQIDMRGVEISGMTGSILTADKLTAHNTFENPELVKPKAFDGGKIKNNIISVTLPAKSIVVLEIL